MIAPARLAAYRTLLAVARADADLASALARARLSLQDERDRALAGEIAAGTLRWQAAFDHVIAAFAGRPVSRLDPEVLTVLRLSVFQLLHLDRVPAAAVVDEAVNLTRKAGKHSAAGFVNALLRRVSRERDRLPLPQVPANAHDRNAAIDYLATTLSHPRWLVGRWLDRYGYDQSVAWARFNNKAALLTLRVNGLAAGREALASMLQTAGVETKPTTFATAGLIVQSGNPLATSLAHRGLFVIQDEASQLVGEFVEARPREKVFDACASPGGKTILLAGAMRDEGQIIAADLRGRRVELLARTVRESGAACVQIIQADAKVSLPFRGRLFDAVLIDAPCSGLGTIRRDPDIRWRRTETDLVRFASIQLDMLDRASTVVKPGGRLIYATCSSEPEENQEVVDAFLSGHPEFAPGQPEEFAGDPDRARVIDPRGFLRTTPVDHGLEAFFAARLVRKN